MKMLDICLKRRNNLAEIKNSFDSAILTDRNSSYQKQTESIMQYQIDSLNRAHTIPVSIESFSPSKIRK